jgi:hypothetical protein
MRQGPGQSLRNLVGDLGDQTLRWCMDETLRLEQQLAQLSSETWPGHRGWITV